MNNIYRHIKSDDQATEYQKILEHFVALLLCLYLLDSGIDFQMDGYVRE